ncbi:ribonuclease P protein component [Inhella inkyongensis]|uniref:Ribonuclease P protein component n=1 Tax=Inhella inkyongensis TaxID=392593 RepID=A0A840S8V5_9BURK|nr:ribonuclease P protein component [Inhella inkyongensis]MBB5205224.1 ribonuclease P protein component [Inhella inkyongensis]
MVAPLPDALGRIQRAVDFERVLQSGSRARSHWFALHYLADAPSRPGAHNLSTACPPDGHSVVDEAPTEAPPPSPSVPSARWLGLVVPKRLARRSVTRSLVKRLGRAGLAEQLKSSTPLPAGLWVLRLRTPIDRKAFPSATSEALRKVLREDLDLLWRRALNPRPPKPRGERP